MAATSYTTLPSSSYVGLGSQGDLYHSANYGTYDSGVGSLTTHPYQYQTTNYATHPTDHQQPSSYSNDYLPSTYSNGGYSTQQPQYYSTDRYAQQSTHNQDTLFNDYTNPQTQRYNNDGNYAAANINTTQTPHKTPMDNRHEESNNQHQRSHADTNQHYPPVSTDNQHHKSLAPPQTNRVRSEQNTSNNPPPPKHQQQRHQSQPPAELNRARSEHQNSKQPAPARHRSPSNARNDPPSATTTKTNNSPPETKTTKSTKMRAAAIKRKEETLEKKRKDGNFPSTQKKSTPPKTDHQQQPTQRSPSDGEQNNKKKPKPNKKQSHSVPKQRKSRRDNYQTDDNYTSADEENNKQHNRNKSKKHTAFSDPHHEKYPSLPPLRHGRAPPYYDPTYDYPYPSGHPLRGRYPYHDDYPPYGSYPYPGRYDHRHRHLYEDPYDIPPYVASYRDPYDGFFDYERRKVKSKTKHHKDKKEPTNNSEDHDGITPNETEREDDTKSQQSKKSKTKKNSNKDDDNENDENKHQHWPHRYQDQPYYDERDMLEVWRQERNDYLKKTFKPSVHDVLYAQQWMKSDSYLENQRRRALRDVQGYYFPYKKYTLKDYKDLQKSESQHNPYASINEATLDRKDRARKRQEYGIHIEKQAADTSGGQQKTPRDMPPKRPWHLSGGDPRDQDKLSKRDRALEYAKVQVVKHRPQNAAKNRFGKPDPTERYVNSLFPQANNDGDGSINERNNQSSDGDDP